ncbi:MAG TPA: hypothetical protein DCQ97_00975 [Chitinophagaceae bacterium]|nr:hypothetical protein [Chitinophagaceae bacterium]
MVIVSGRACARQQAVVKQKKSRAVTCFTSGLFFQTYINSMIPEMPVLLPVPEAGVFYIFVADGE